jgi:hypothetical protein
LRQVYAGGHEWTGRVYGNSAITGLVDRLEKLGFIARAESPAGLEEIEKAKGVIRRVNEEIKEGFKAEEIDAFKKVLNLDSDAAGVWLTQRRSILSG